MDRATKLTLAERAEPQLLEIERYAEDWHRREDFAGMGTDEEDGIVALLVSPELDALLRDAEREHGEPFWSRLQDLDIPVPIRVFLGLAPYGWSVLLRAEAEELFNVLRANGWAPDNWLAARVN